MGALDPDRADGGVGTRIECYGNFQRTAGMIGDHIARGDLRLGIAELAPGFDKPLLGLGDDRGTRHLTGDEPYFGGQLDHIGFDYRHWRAVGDAQGAEDKFRARINSNPDLAWFGQGGVGRN